MNLFELAATLRDRAAPALLVSIALIAIAGCSTVEEAIAAHGKAAEASVVRIEAVRDAMAAQPMLASEGFDTGGASLVADLVASDTGSSSANTGVVYVEDLAELGALGSVYARDDGTLGVARCAAYVRHRTEPWDPTKPDRWEESVLGNSVASRLEHCGNLTHLLVIRTVELVRPGPPRIELATGATSPPLTPGTAVNKASCGTTGWRCSFDGGYVKAEVHLYSLHPLQHRGGITVAAESTERLSFPSVPIEKALDDDLAKAFATALDAALGAKVKVMR